MNRYIEIAWWIRMSDIIHWKRLAMCVSVCSHLQTKNPIWWNGFSVALRLPLVPLPHATQKHQFSFPIQSTHSGYVSVADTLAVDAVRLLTLKWITSNEIGLTTKCLGNFWSGFGSSNRSSWFATEANKSFESPPAPPKIRIVWSPAMGKLGFVCRRRSVWPNALSQILIKYSESRKKNKWKFAWIKWKLKHKMLLQSPSPIVPSKSLLCIISAPPSTVNASPIMIMRCIYCLFADDRAKHLRLAIRHATDDLLMKCLNSSNLCSLLAATVGANVQKMSSTEDTRKSLSYRFLNIARLHLCPPRLSCLKHLPNRYSHLGKLSPAILNAIP